MKLVRSALLCVVVFAGLAGCGTGIPPVGNYATVYGRVTDAASGAAIGGATIVLNDVSTAQSDANGNYRITGVPTGPWSYQASAPNYVTLGATNPPDLQPGEQRNFPIALTHQ